MTPSRKVEIVVTCGDPQGVGPEVVAKAARAAVAEDAALAITLMGPLDVWREAAVDASWPIVAADAEVEAGVFLVATEGATTPAAPPPSAYGGATSLKALDAALARVLASQGRALATAPLSKAAARLFGAADFDGHTRYVAARCGVEKPVMLFDAPGFRVALATVHLALKDVPKAATKARLVDTIRTIDADLKRRFGVANPRIDVLGLNPHAGEGGAFGSEEIEEIVPAIDALRAEGIAANGPFAADAYFIEGFKERADCVVAMYHDQGLAPLKALAFAEAVNVTLGLPIVRTSPDHGTAYALKGRGVADATPMLSALRTAARLLRASP